MDVLSPLLQLLFVRFALQALFLAPVVMLSDRTLKASPRIMKLIGLRMHRNMLTLAAKGMPLLRFFSGVCAITR